MKREFGKCYGSVVNVTSRNLCGSWFTREWHVANKEEWMAPVKVVPWRHILREKKNNEGREEIWQTQVVSPMWGKYNELFN